jgi:hypothetical protein
VAHVHRSTGRTASGIKVERLAFLVSVENDIEIPDKEIPEQDKPDRIHDVPFLLMTHR